MKRFIVKTLAVMLACIFVLSGINFSIFADDASTVDLGDKLAAINVSISGQINMLFYFSEVGKVDYYDVKVGDTTYPTTRVSNMDKDAKGRYVLEVPLAAAQQTETISITGKTDGGDQDEPRKYSAKMYVDKALEMAKSDANLHDAAEALKSMLNYGAMAQACFPNISSSELANEGLYFGATNPINNMSLDDIYGKTSYKVQATDESKLDFSSTEVCLDSVVTIKCYLDIDETVVDRNKLDVIIENVYCGNQIYEDANGYYVRVNNIPATKYNYQYSIVVTDGTYTVSTQFSVLNDLINRLTKNSNTAEANVVYSMFQYYVAMSKHAKKDIDRKPATCSHDRSYVDATLNYAEICSDCGEDITPTDLVGNAADLSNKVNAHYSEYKDGKFVIDPYRKNYVVENSNMIFRYGLHESVSQLATITDRDNNVYVQDTMDVYVKIGDETYYASNSIHSAEANIYRYGYYYYDAHIYGQNFSNPVNWNTVGWENIELQSFYRSTNYLRGNNMKADTTKSQVRDGSQMECTISSTSDPHVDTNVSLEYPMAHNGYNVMQITMTSDSTSEIELFYQTDEMTEFKQERTIKFDVQADGQEHTYTILFGDHIEKYGEFTINAIRLDPNGAAGSKIKVKSIGFAKVDFGETAGLLYLDRGLHTYADKMHQALSLVATKDITGINEIGMTTTVTNVTDLYIKQTDGTEVLSIASGSPVENVAYVGFVINGVGVFGYILPADVDNGISYNNGTISVSFDGTSYTITQKITDVASIAKQPTITEDNKSDLDTYKAKDSTIGTSLNIYNSPTKFFFGQRIYTADVDTADAAKVAAALEVFKTEAEIERNPLGADNIKINTEKTPNATFDGYDPIRGIYAFTIPDHIGFKDGYEVAQNFHGTVSFTITGDDTDRNMYVMAYTPGLTVEGGAVLDKDDQMLPIPTEVSKNFAHEFGVPKYQWGDIGYSEVRVPVKVKAGETQELTVLHLFMNWGQYPLKQLSSIQFFAPYYHLSTGVTETNCIANYYVHGKDLQTLPDHRAMNSGVWWGDTKGDPQYDNGGFHYWLQYTSGGKSQASEPIKSVINSSGPTYADIDMTYRSDDSKIEVTYTHLEMPQEDANRAYYTMTYTFLDEVTIDDTFYENFSFYSVNGYVDGYANLSYWENDSVQSVVKSTGTSGAKYTLGGTCPYFTMYNCEGLVEVDDPNTTKDERNSQSANVSFLIYNSKVDLDNNGVDDGINFAVYEKNRLAALTLDIGDTDKTIPKGATITICAIVMPWGQKDAANDQLVKDVRLNTLLNPVKAAAVENANVVDNGFVPTVETTNGKDAIFTIGNGYAGNPKEGYNVTFRVDGFNILGTPKLYEQVTDENGNKSWQPVEITSVNSHDNSGNKHEYDGYAVHYNKVYNEDSKTYKVTYSYSFVTEITDVNPTRTFKVVVDDTYIDWEENFGELYFGADAIYNYVYNGDINRKDENENLSQRLVWPDPEKPEITNYTKLSDDGSYLTLVDKNIGDPCSAQFKMMKTSAVRYMVIKYKHENGVTPDGLQFYMSTTLTGATGKGDLFTLTSSVIKANGEWQVMVVDLAALDAENNMYAMEPNSDGTYTLSSFRFDEFVSTDKGADSYDVAYIAFCRDLDDAIELNSGDVSNMTYVDGVSSSCAMSKVANNTTYISYEDIYNTVGENHPYLSRELNEEDGYVVLTNNTDATDVNFEITSLVRATTPKYAIIRYKTEPTNKSKINVYATTASHKGQYDYIEFTPTNDGEWHNAIIVLDGSSCYVHGERVTFLRLDVCEGQKGDSIAIDHILLCDDLSSISGEEIEIKSACNKDSLYGDVDKRFNYNTHKSITATIVEFSGWTGVTGHGAEGIAYVITDDKGFETVYDLKDSRSGSGYYFENDGITDHLKGTNDWSAYTKGYRFKFVADLSAWAGHTVTLTVRETIDGGFTVDTCSIEVKVPKADDASIVLHPGYISGHEIYYKVDTKEHNRYLNANGSVTITESSKSDGDAYVTLTDYAKNLTPKYAIIKYRTTNEDTMAVFASSGSYKAGSYVTCELETDGEWHTVKVDLTKVQGPETNMGFVYGEKVSYLRLDVCETPNSRKSITIGYVLLCDDEDMPVCFDPGYLDGAELAGGKLDSNGMTSSAVINLDRTLTITVDNTNLTKDADTYYVIQNSEDATTGITPEIARQYAVIRYKSEGATRIMIHAKTGSRDGAYTSVPAIADGAWHTAIIDISSNIPDNYKAGETLEWLRFDICEVAGKKQSFTFDYVWLTDDISKVEYEAYEKLNVSFVGSDLYYQGTDHYGDSNTKENEDSQYTIVQNGDGTVSVARKNANGEVYITALFNREGASSKVVTGKYFVIKYRTSASGVTGMGSLFASTSLYSAKGGEIHDSYGSFPAHSDGEWHVAAFDLSKIETVVANDDDTYSVNYVRFAFNGLAVGEKVDIAYIGMCDSLSDVEQGYDVKFTKDTFTDNGNVTFNKTEDILTVTSNGNGLGRFWIKVPEGTVTGKYITVRYRYNATNVKNDKLVYLKTWTSTTYSAPNTEADAQKVNVLADGEWHTIVIDATKSGSVSTFDGTYLHKYVGFDFFTSDTANKDDYVEISHIGFSNSLEDIVYEYGDVEYDLDYQFSNDGATLGGSTHTWMSSLKSKTSSDGNYTGWATVDGKITGMYYKIVSKNNETPWLNCTNTIVGPDHDLYDTYNSEDNAKTARTIWLGTGGNITNAVTFTIPADALSGYVSGEVVTVYVAASIDGIDDGARVVFVSCELTIK